MAEYDTGAYQRALAGGRFEGSEAEGGKAARAAAQLQWEQTPGGQTWLSNQPGSPQSYDKLAAGVPSTLDFVKQSAEPSRQALSSLVMAQRSQAKPLDVYTQLEEQMGIPAQRKAAATLREQVGNLEDALRSVRGQVAGTTRESMVTEAQRQRMEQATARPLQENLATIGTALGRVSESISNAERTLGTRVDLYLRGNEQELQTYKTQLDFELAQQAQMVTGFTSDKQTNLELSLAKLRRGEQLADQERQEAFTLLREENQYQRELERMKKESEQRITELKNQRQQTLEDARLQRGYDVEDAQREFERNKELERFKSNLAIDEWLKTTGTRSSGGTGDDSSWLDFLSDIVPSTQALGTTQPQTQQSPPMSANPGTVQEYNGAKWVMMSNGSWRQIIE